jgi:hypothetical protein
MKQTRLVARYACLLAALLIGALAPLPVAQAQTKWCTTKVTQVLVWSNGKLSVSGPQFSQTGGASVWLCSVQTDSYCSAWLSILEAAALSGKTVRIALDLPSDLDCDKLPGTPIINYVSLYP